MKYDSRKVIVEAHKPADWHFMFFVVDIKNKKEPIFLAACGEPEAAKKVRDFYNSKYVIIIQII